MPSLASTKFPGWKTGFKGVGFDYITIRNAIREKTASHVASGGKGLAKIFYFRSELRNLG